MRSLKAFCRVATLSLAGLLVLSTAHAQSDYPNRDIRIICGFPAGSGADVFVRFFVEHMKPFSSKPLIVDNKPGALSVIAAEHVARSKPDGYTLFLTGATPITSSVYLFRQLKYDPIKDFTPISTLLWQPVILTVSSKSSITSVKDLIAHLRAKGDKATYGGTSTSSVANAEIFKSRLGLDQVVQVAYKESQQAIADMYDGSLDFIFADTVAAMESSRSGRTRSIAVTTPQRVSSLPDLPTLHESGLEGYDWTSWWAVLAPAGTPPEIVATVNGWVNQMMVKPEVKAFLNQFGADPMPGNPESTRKRQVEEIERWKEIVRIAKIEPQ